MPKTEAELLRSLQDPPEGYGRDPEADYSHKHVIDLLEVFGTINADERGTCFGIASSLVFAAVRKDLGTFKKDMEIIAHMDAEPASIQWYKNLLHSNDADKQEAKRMLIFAMARLAEINIMQEPFQYPHFYTKDKNKSSTQLGLLNDFALFFQPHEKNDPLRSKISASEALRTFGMYTDDQLRESMEELRIACLKIEATHPVGFILNVEAHAIPVVYDPEKKLWILGDANLLPTKVYHDDDFDMMLDDFMLGVAKIKSRKDCNMTALMMCEDHSKNEVIDKLAGWKEKQLLYSKASLAEIGNLSESQKAASLYLAISENDLDVIKPWLENLNLSENDKNLLFSYEQPSEDGISPPKKQNTLTTAVIQSNLEVVKYLVETFHIMPGELNTLESNKDNPFWCALAEGHTDIVEYFLELVPVIPSMAILDAARFGHVDMVKLLVDKGADLNFRDSDGATLLSEAAYEGRLEIIKYLLSRKDYKHDIDAQNDAGYTALMQASENGQLEVVSYLLEKGAEPNMSADDETNALSLAAAAGQTVIVKLLLSHGATPNLSDNINQNFLLLAASTGRAELLSVFMKSQKNATIVRGLKTEDGSTMLDLAVDSGNVETARLFMDSDMGTALGETLLLKAVQNNDIEMTAELLIRGARLDTNIAEAEIRADFINAIKDKNIAWIHALLASFDEIEQYNLPGGSLLYLAAQSENIQIVDALIKKGCQLLPNEKKAATGYFLGAVHDKDLGLVQILLHSGFHVDEVDVSGNPAIFTAAEVGDIKMFQALMKAGANIHIKNKKGETALHIAAKNGHLSIVKELIGNGADVNVLKNGGEKSTFMAVSEGRLAVVQYLLHNDHNQADINLPNDQNESPFYRAVSLTVHHPVYNNIVNELLNSGKKLKIDHQNEAGKTPLWRAAELGGINTVNKLIRRGANAEITNSAGVSPADAARNGGNIELANNLDKGSDNTATHKATTFYCKGAPTFRENTTALHPPTGSGSRVGHIKPAGAL